MPCRRKKSAMSPRDSLPLFCVLAALAAPACATAAPNMEEGNWEITMKMEAEGMSMAMPKVDQCITKNDIVPYASLAKGGSCDIKEQTDSGDTVRWRMVCRMPDGTSETEGKITYFGKRYEGTMQTTMMPTGGEPMSLNYQIQGTRIGACIDATAPK